MEFIIITIVILIISTILGMIFSYNLKKIKHIADDGELDEIAKKLPSNKEICKSYLKILKNDKTKIEECENNEASLYIVLTDKILIADIKNTYTRVQTLAHECLHSVQDKRILNFNFIYSNIYLICYVVMIVLTIFKVLPNKMMFFAIFLVLSLVYYMVRMYLENDAMIKARYLAKEYLQERTEVTKEEIEKLVNGFDKINLLGMKAIHYQMFFNIMVKALIFLIICIMR